MYNNALSTLLSNKEKWSALFNALRVNERAWMINWLNQKGIAVPEAATVSSCKVMNQARKALIMKACDDANGDLRQQLTLTDEQKREALENAQEQHKVAWMHQWINSQREAGHDLSDNPIQDALNAYQQQRQEEAPGNTEVTMPDGPIPFDKPTITSFVL